MTSHNKIKIAVFASGSGSNFENLASYFQLNKSISLEHLFCNNPNAFAIERSKKLGINYTVFNKTDFTHSDKIKSELIALKIDYIVLAGFLWLIPSYLVEMFPNKIINIHPALLPNYGGKGMYGHRVHEAVHQAKEKQSGITIHLVNEKYDEGKIIFQQSVPLTDSDTPDTIAEKVHDLEYIHFPEVIEKFILNS